MTHINSFVGIHVCGPMAFIQKPTEDGRRIHSLKIGKLPLPIVVDSYSYEPLKYVGVLTTVEIVGLSVWGYGQITDEETSRWFDEDHMKNDMPARIAVGIDVSVADCYYSSESQLEIGGTLEAVTLLPGRNSAWPEAMFMRYTRNPS